MSRKLVSENFVPSLILIINAILFDKTVLGNLDCMTVFAHVFFYFHQVVIDKSSNLCSVYDIDVKKLAHSEQITTINEP